jgi:hypothetical protein
MHASSSKISTHAQHAGDSLASDWRVVGSEAGSDGFYLYVGTLRNGPTLR